MSVSPAAKVRARGPKVLCVVILCVSNTTVWLRVDPFMVSGCVSLCKSVEGREGVCCKEVYCCGREMGSVLCRGMDGKEGDVLCMCVCMRDSCCVRVCKRGRSCVAYEGGVLGKGNKVLCCEGEGRNV